MSLPAPMYLITLVALLCICNVHLQPSPPQLYLIHKGRVYWDGSVMVKDGDFVEFHCNVPFDNFATTGQLIITKDSKILTKNCGHLDDDRQMCRLVFHAKREDAGVYECCFSLSDDIAFEKEILTCSNSHLNLTVTYP